MTDRFTPQQRHAVMAAIRGKNTKPEMLVRKFLWACGYRYRINYKRLPGKPDIALRKYRTCIFVNGCFWHGHEGCRYCTLPKTHTEYWKHKIERNRIRDAKVKLELSAMGWHSIVVWECQLKPNQREKTLVWLDYTLNDLFLRDHQQKAVPYQVPDETMFIAAEDSRDLYRKSQ